MHLVCQSVTPCRVRCLLGEDFRNSRSEPTDLARAEFYRRLIPTQISAMSSGEASYSSSSSLRCLTLSCFGLCQSVSSPGLCFEQRLAQVSLLLILFLNFAFEVLYLWLAWTCTTDGAFMSGLVAQRFPIDGERGGPLRSPNPVQANIPAR